MKFASKQDFVVRTTAEWEHLWRRFEQLEKPQTAHQILAHLHGWQRLFLGWWKADVAGEEPDLPARGFSWRETPALNASLDEEFADLPLKSIVIRLKRSHGRVMRIADSLTERQLMAPGQFGWTGKLPLVSYLGPNTFGHYRWACKKLKKLS